MRHSRRTGNVPARRWIAVMLSIALSGPVQVFAADDDFPRELQRMYDFAEQAAYEGDFQAASAHVDNARDWLRDESNRRKLYEARFDWKSVKSLAEAFDAWIAAEQGDLCRAKTLFFNVLGALKRMVLPIRKSIVHLQYGDYEFSKSFPVTDVKHFLEMFRNDPNLTDGEKTKLCDAINQGRRRLKVARGHYDKASEVLIDQLLMQNDLSKRLRARSEQALARCTMIAGEDQPTEYRATERHLLESEKWFRETEIFKQILDPNAKWPKTLKQLKREMKDKPAADPQLNDDLITDYARIITEWLRFRCDQARFETIRTAQAEGREADEAHVNVEVFYRKGRDVCDEHLRRENTLRFHIDLAQGGYYLQRATETAKRAAAAAPGPARNKLEAATRSFYLDAAFAAQDALAAMQESSQMKSTHPLRFEALLLELRAHDAGHPLGNRKRRQILDELLRWIDEQPCKG